MVAPLIGSLLGLGTAGLSLGLDQASRAKSRNRIKNTASAVPGQQRQLARRLNAQASSAKTANPMLERRNATLAATDAQLGFSNQRIQEESEKSRLLAQAERADSAALTSGLSGLAGGLAGGAQMLGGLGGKEAGLGGVASGASKLSGKAPGQTLEGAIPQGRVPQSGGQLFNTPQLLGQPAAQMPQSGAGPSMGANQYPGAGAAGNPVSFRRPDMAFTQAEAYPPPLDPAQSDMTFTQEQAYAPDMSFSQAEAYPPSPWAMNSTQPQMFANAFQAVPPAAAPAPQPQAPQMQGAQYGAPGGFQSAPAAAPAPQAGGAPVQPQAPNTPIGQMTLQELMTLLGGMQ